MEADGVYNKFNRGEIDELALARDDVEKVNNSCALMENFMPLRLGPMQFRPGLEFLDDIANTAVKMIPFIAAIGNHAILEFSHNQMKVWVNDALVTTTAVTTVLADGDFTNGFTDWTNASQAGATATIPSGEAILTGNGKSSAFIWQTTSSVQTSTEHTIEISILDAPMLVKIGENGVNSKEFFEGFLSPGNHSLVFSTNSSEVTFTFSNKEKYAAKVNSCVFASTGDLTLTTDVATLELESIRPTQSGDVVFMAYIPISGSNNRLFQVERRGVKSWSVVKTRVDDGPFGLLNDSPVTLQIGNYDGSTTLTAAGTPFFFTTDSVGELYRLASEGQHVLSHIDTDNHGTESVKVTGVSTGRDLDIITGNMAATSTTVTLQRSTDNLEWSFAASYTANTTVTFNDTEDNAIVYYRLWVLDGDLGSAVDLTLDAFTASGGIEGICRVVEYTSATVVNVQVLSHFGDISIPTLDWSRGQWNINDGYPTSTRLYEGRLWYGRKGSLWGSVSDSFQSFDRDLLGDSKSIFKTIGFGPSDDSHWLADSSRLIIGLTTDEISVRSSSFGEVLTQTNVNLKPGSTQGVAPTDPVIINNLIYYVQRSGIKIMEAEYNFSSDSHKSTDLMTLHQTICDPGIKRIAISRQPETRIYVVLDDGDVRIYLMDPAEDVAAWSRMTVTAYTKATSPATVRDVVVLPGLVEDSVYFVVDRDSTRSLEKMAKLSDFVDEHFDGFVKFTSPGTTISGLTRFGNGNSVQVWADDQDRGSFTISAGAITVPSAWTDVVVGLTYVADYNSNKLGQYADYSVLNKRVRVVDLGIIAKDLYPGVLTYGPDSSNLTDMPNIENGTDISTTAPIADYDFTPFEFDGSYNTNSRVFLRATGPCIIKAITYGVKDAKRKASKSKRSE